MSKRLVWVDIEIKVTTEKAICVEDLKGNDCWLPKSMISDTEDDLEPGVETRIEIPEWIAEKNDLV